MALPSHLARITVDRIIDFIVPLLLTTAGSDVEAARQAALQMLVEFAPQTAEELGLAAEVIAFRFEALDMLRESSVPGTSKATVIEMLKVANTLRRSEAGAQRKLDALQRPRRAATKNEPAHARATAAALPPSAPKPPAQTPSPARTPALQTPTAKTPMGQTPPLDTMIAQAVAAQSKPAHAAAMPAASAGCIDARLQRVTADLTGQNRNQAALDDTLASIAVAYRRGDHRGVANAITGTATTATSAAALIGRGA
jgi:hypothetical protein